MGRRVGLVIVLVNRRKDTHVTVIDKGVEGRAQRAAASFFVRRDVSVFQLADADISQSRSRTILRFDFFFPVGALDLYGASWALIARLGDGPK